MTETFQLRRFNFAGSPSLIYRVDGLFSKIGIENCLHPRFETQKRNYHSGVDYLHAGLTEGYDLWRKGLKTEGAFYPASAVYVALAVKLTGVQLPAPEDWEKGVDAESSPRAGPMPIRAVSNAFADVVRDTRILHDWRRAYLGPEHEKTREAAGWALVAEGFARVLFAGSKNRWIGWNGRDFPEPDLPDFELASSWEYVVRTTPPARSWYA